MKIGDGRGKGDVVKKQVYSLHAETQIQTIGIVMITDNCKDEDMEDDDYDDDYDDDDDADDNDDDEPEDTDDDNNEDND